MKLELKAICLVSTLSILSGYTNNALALETSQAASTSQAIKAPNAGYIKWYFKKEFGDVTTVSLNHAIDVANTFLKKHPGTTLTLQLPAGRYTLKHNDTNGDLGTIDFSYLNGDSGSTLVFQGATNEYTTFVIEPYWQPAVGGKSVNNLKIRNIHFTRNTYSATQGEVLDTGKGWVDLRIQDGFPTPGSLWLPTDKGHYLKKLSADIDNPHIMENQQQISYGYPRKKLSPPTQISPNDDRGWRIHLTGANTNLADEPWGYYPGQLVAIKAKRTGDCFDFQQSGKNLGFDNVKWTHSTRGVFHGYFDGISLHNCIVEKPDPIYGQTPGLSSSAGGPQISPGYGLVKNISIINSTFDSSGDDNLAFFNAENVKLINVKTMHAFNRNLYISNNTKNICLKNVIINGKNVTDLKNKKVLPAEGFEGGNLATVCE